MILVSAQVGARPERKDGDHPALSQRQRPATLAANETPKSPKSPVSKVSRGDGLVHSRHVSVELVFDSEFTGGKFSGRWKTDQAGPAVDTAWKWSIQLVMGSQSDSR